ncbi:MAG TPA: hypothetical protein GX708_04910 [Gallicola sp.]|nr:hypothetical protein [Gallicola sp.]
MEEKKYIEKVESFIESAKKIEEITVDLVAGVESLSTSISELKGTESLRDSLDSLNSNMELIQTYNSSILTAFKNIEDYNNIDNNIDQANTNIKQVLESLQAINGKTKELLEKSNNLDLTQVVNSLNEISRDISEYSKKFEEELIPLITNDINKKISDIQSEIDTIKNSFQTYKEIMDSMLKEFQKESSTIVEAFTEVIKTNKELISLMNDMKNNNKSTEEYIDQLLSRWYDENHGLFGRKKKNKK